ncbi:uncharacterized protein [Lolium perenne]|uniref:uncharacterized protein isoform X1 n=1 Tax=Lolium perenne TaxID=4522 RepID=UPI003A9A637D
MQSRNSGGGADAAHEPVLTEDAVCHELVLTEAAVRLVLVLTEDRSTPAAFGTVQEIEPAVYWLRGSVSLSPSVPSTPPRQAGQVDGNVPWQAVDGSEWGWIEQQ